MKLVKKMVTKYGQAVAALAFVFAVIGANSPCVLPYYEPEEPAGLEKYKKFNK